MKKMIKSNYTFDPDTFDNSYFNTVYFPQVKIVNETNFRKSLR